MAESYCDTAHGRMPQLSPRPKGGQPSMTVAQDPAKLPLPNDCHVGSIRLTTASVRIIGRSGKRDMFSDAVLAFQDGFPTPSISGRLASRTSRFDASDCEGLRWPRSDSLRKVEGDGGRRCMESRRYSSCVRLRSAVFGCRYLGCVRLQRGCRLGHSGHAVARNGRRCTPLPGSNHH